MRKRYRGKIRRDETEVMFFHNPSHLWGRSDRDGKPSLDKFEEFVG
jgi:hypothetical protein